MKTKFFTALKAKCKDMGLSKKALEELTEIGAKGLTDESTDDEINTAVDSLVPVAKAMQSEITRKTTPKPSTKPSETNEGGEGNENKPGGAEMPEWAKAWQTRLDNLEKENAALKAEKTASERNATIAEKAKSHGIPEYLLKRMSFAEDADIDKELAALKQDLVNNNLMPKGQAHEGGSTDVNDIAAAEAWAASLPNR